MRRSMLVLEDMLAAEGWSSADMDSVFCLQLHVSAGALLTLFYIAPPCDVTVTAPPTNVS